MEQRFLGPLAEPPIRVLLAAKRHPWAPRLRRGKEKA